MPRKLTKTRKLKQPKFKSKFELATYNSLSGYEVEYEPEAFTYTTTARYWPDFRVHRHGGITLYIECKGWLRPGDRQKLAAVKTQYPGLDLRILFHPKCKPRDIRWAEKHKFIYAIGEIPESWLC